MSWKEDNYFDYEVDTLYKIGYISSKLEEKGVLDKVYKQFEDNYYFMVCNILQQFKEGKELTNRQISCLAKFIEFNNLEDWVEGA